MTEETQLPALTEIVAVGDFFSCSWGYDQTNVNFYEVVAVTKASVKLIPCATSVVSDEGSGITHVAPLAGSRRDHDSFLPVDKPSIKRARIYEFDGKVEVSVRMESYAFASRWDLKPRYETAQGWGH